MSVEDKLNKRLASFGLTTKDLSKEQLSKAKKACHGSGVGGFFSSEELISKSLSKKRK